MCVPGKGKFRIRTREADASTMASGCRAGACGHRPGRAGFQALPPTAASPGSCAPRGFLAGGCLRRSQAGSLRAWSRVGTSVFTAKASTFRGGLRPVLQWVAPPALRCRPLVKGGCFTAAVARHSQGGTALCLGRMAITLLFNVIHERFKNKARTTHSFSHLYAPNFVCLKSERCLIQLQCPAGEVSGK